MSSIPGQGWTQATIFQLGKNKTLAVNLSFHKNNREKVRNILKSRGVHKGIILLKGGEISNQYDTDHENLFLQDSWFQYLFGVREPGFFGAVMIEGNKSILFIPHLSEEYEIWCGKILPKSYYQSHYDVDEVYFADELSSWLTETLPSEGQIHLLKGLNTDSGTNLEPFNHPALDSKLIETSYLFHALSTARVTKSAEEVEILRYSAMVSSNAHVAVQRFARAGMIEYELEAKFLYEIYSQGGCRTSAYTSICGCGPNGAVLHYGHAAAPNDRVLQSSDMALLDMGSSYHGYCSDITCSFPISGQFTSDQRAVYEGVLAAQVAVMKAAKPGASWPHCHHLAELEIIKALLGLGILQGGSPEELSTKGLGAVFFPHGLGHLLGLDTHDCGGYIDGTPARPTPPGLRKLRTARVLEPGMILTNEPGCYFIDALIDKALNDESQASHIDRDIIARFRGFGGVRLEDDILITEDGVDNFTLCPRTVKEVESVLNGGPWPPLVDEAPFLKRHWVSLGADGHGLVTVTLPN